MRKTDLVLASVALTIVIFRELTVAARLCPPRRASPNPTLSSYSPTTCATTTSNTCPRLRPSWEPRACASRVHLSPTHCVVLQYVKYKGGARELYNLGVDPYELTNRHNASTRPKALATRLQALKTWGADAAVTCHTAEDRQ